jgi:hypothetical protein
MASTVAASVGVKKYQPIGLTGRGGAPEKGDQGMLPESVRPSAVAARIGNAAADANRRRRFNPPEECCMKIPAPTILLFVGGDPRSEFRPDQFASRHVAAAKTGAAQFWARPG